VAFTAEPGLTEANFSILFNNHTNFTGLANPTASNQMGTNQTPQAPGLSGGADHEMTEAIDLPMREVAPGYYVGYYTVTSNLISPASRVEFKAVQAGHEYRIVAPWQIWINAPLPADAGQGQGDTDQPASMLLPGDQTIVNLIVQAEDSDGEFNPGDTVKISFDSEAGQTASFVLRAPLSNLTGTTPVVLARDVATVQAANTHAFMMSESKTIPGHYEGEYTIPTQLTPDRKIILTIEVRVVDSLHYAAYKTIQLQVIVP
jgi:hypothetical protein